MHSNLLKFLAPSIVFSFSLATQATAQSLPLSDYLALQPGTWNYSPTALATPTATATRTEYTRVLNVGGGLSLTNVTRLTEDGLISVREISTLPDDEYDESQDGTLVILPSILVVNGPATNTTSTYSGTADGELYSGVNSSTVRVRDFENVTIPAGTFSALKVEVTSTYNEDGESGTDKDTLWLAKGIGIVKFRFETQGGIDETFTLSTFPAAPATPNGTSATPMIGSVDLSWSPVAGIDDYVISRGTTTDPEMATLLGTSDTPSFSDDTVDGTTQYQYFIQSRIGGAKSAFSAPIEGAALAEMSFADILADLGLTGDDTLPTADPNNDGIDNGIAYALGLPLVGNLSPEMWERLPQPAPPSENNRPVLKITLPQNAPNDVTYIIETNTSLSMEGWNEIARKTGNGPWSGDATVTPENVGDELVCTSIEGTQDLPTSPTGFMRMRVELVE